MALADFTPSNLVAAGICKDARFPHMGPKDCEVWSAFLRSGVQLGSGWRYDVALGDSCLAEVCGDDPLAAMWVTLRRKRIDAVGTDANGVVIVEVKPTASFSALGQLLGYADLWTRQRGSPAYPAMACVCWKVDPDLVPAFLRHGVRVVALRDLAPHVEGLLR